MSQVFSSNPQKPIVIKADTATLSIAGANGATAHALVTDITITAQRNASVSNAMNGGRFLIVSTPTFSVQMGTVVAKREFLEAIGLFNDVCDTFTLTLDLTGASTCEGADKTKYVLSGCYSVSFTTQLNTDRGMITSGVTLLATAMDLKN